MALISDVPPDQQKQSFDTHEDSAFFAEFLQSTFDSFPGSVFPATLDHEQPIPSIATRHRLSFDANTLLHRRIGSRPDSNNLDSAIFLAISARSRNMGVPFQFKWSGRLPKYGG